MPEIAKGLSPGAGVREARGAVILPEKSFYGESVLEIVSEKNIRNFLELRDSRRVAVYLFK